MQTNGQGGGIPRVLWTFWDEGFKCAPEVVRFSLYSWQKLNPGWVIRALDRSTLRDWADPWALCPFYDDLPIQKQSNLLRKELLATYGGIWADATTVCLRPLDHWLPRDCPDGFVMWRNEEFDRDICNWFIGAEAGNSFLRAWLESYADFFSRPRLHHPRGKSLVRLRAYLSLQPTALHRARFWNSWVARRILKVYPYFISHYLAGHLLHRDKRFMSSLDSGALMSQPAPLNLHSPVTTEIIHHSKNCNLAMLKLSHHADQAETVKQWLPRIREIVENGIKKIG